MHKSVSELSGGCQEVFHQRWNHLTDPHVRALAWLLDAPDLLDAAAPQWRGKIAAYVDPELAAWLAEYDQTPQKLQALHAYIGRLPSTRLGLYAEKLMAFYFEQRQLLVAHSVQVRASKNDTVGEFDFLLRLDGGVAHWEFATKFYLLESSGGTLQADDFLGPNLADSLGAKMQKILQQQLALSLHPASQVHLAEPVTAAQALVKGWLFYPKGELQQPAIPGVSAYACRGYWSSLSDLQLDENALYQLLPRLHWLAPAKMAVEQALSPDAARLALSQHFSIDGSPLLLATLRSDGEYALETRRGFVVVDDWAARAAQQRHLNAAAARPR